MEELSYMLTQYFISCVHVRFYFSLPFIFTLLAASIFHFLWTTKPWRSWWKLMQRHCSNVLKHDTPGIISCGLCFGANQHTKITDSLNRSSRRWFVNGPRWQTKRSAASWSALIACETSCAFEKMLPCNRMKTQWNASFLKKRIFTSLLQNKSRTTIFV